MYLLLCLFSSAMAVLALSSWAAKQGSGFAVDELTGQITGIGDYRRAVVQAGAAAIGILVAILLSNIDYRSLVNVWPVHVVLTWGLVLPTLVIRNVTLGPLTIGYNAGDTDNYSWYKLGGFTFQPTETMSVGETLHNTVWSVASGGAMEALRSAVLPRVSSSVCWLRVTFSTGMMSGSGRGVGGVVSHSFLRASRSSLALLSV